MAIEPTNAYKVSDGSCFLKRSDAYNAEMVYLRRALVKCGADTVKADATEFAKFVASVRDWLGKAESLATAMNVDPEMKAR